MSLTSCWCDLSSGDKEFYGSESKFCLRVIVSYKPSAILWPWSSLLMAHSNYNHIIVWWGVLAHFLHFVMFKCWSGVGTSNFSEMKGRHLTLAKRTNFMANFWRHLKWWSRKFDKEVILYRFYIVPYTHFTKIGGSDTTSTLQHPKRFKMSKVGQNYLPNHDLLRLWG